MNEFIDKALSLQMKWRTCLKSFFVYTKKTHEAIVVGTHGQLLQ